MRHRIMRNPTVLLLLLTLAATGCDTNTNLSVGDGELFDVIEGMPAIDHATGQGILRLVNDPTVDVDFLDLDVGLDSRAAQRIVAHRQGDDGEDGTWDDNLFDDLFELTDIAWVGPSALQKLGNMAHELDLVPAVMVEGVTFTFTEQEDTLLLVNLADLDDLDFGAGLDVRAAEAIVSGGVYTNLVQVGDRPYVGPAALEQLKAFAGVWAAQTPLDD
jgi:DNA uptake protein ComE-like DNA-binding protein